MREFKGAGAEPRRRRWSFSDCIFDEANWSLTVAGSRVAIETKPLELLRELIISAGDLVTKAQLLDRIWPDVVVVEASIPTAVHKLRLALNDEARVPHMIETVQRLGYRLTVPVELDHGLAPVGEAIVEADAATAEINTRKRTPAVLTLSIMAGLLLLAAAVGLPLIRPQHAIALEVSRPVSQRDAANALRDLDVGAVERMLAAGWDPNKPFDDQGNGAINYVLNRCEWDRGHDQEQMVLMVRTLIDGGARIDQRNVWGDTPYSIAKAVRYCGPDHPVTNSLRTMCFAGYKPFGDRCLASYELGDRRAAHGKDPAPR